ncbi:hypothetical protein [uncultured Hymenobacter sp.]|uniref:hypothetical protein n=1 Tax=uncultured Hymenobacter sp. TaxID=170016 RepID=UPI0035CA03B1
MGVAAPYRVHDAKITGSLGATFFSPFDQPRYFFGCCFIQALPTEVRNFAGQSPLWTLANEAVWLGLPCLLFLAVTLVVATQEPTF